jgi:hypothetical protein
MTMDEVREFAQAQGILSLHKFSNKIDLIKTIQLSMGREECFGEDCIFNNKWCEWKDECGKFKMSENGGATFNS